jgi:hypothetical protein
MMRTNLKMAMVPAALLALAACGRSSKPTASNDLTQDLKLASTSIDLASTRPTNIVLSPSEEMPPVSKPERARTLKRAAGPKAVASHHPTVRATPTAKVAAAEPAPQVEQTAAAPAPAPMPAPEPALPPATRPSPSPYPSHDPGTGRAQGEGDGIGIGAVIGGILGAVIRGGAVDGDHCEPHGGRHGRGGVYGSGGYYPGPGGIRAPFPINPMH